MLINGAVLLIVLFSSACCFVFCGKLDLLDPPIEKACCYLKGKHVTKSCVARNCGAARHELTEPPKLPVINTALVASGGVGSKRI